MSLTTTITTVHSPSSEWFRKRREYDVYAKSSQDIPDDLIDYFCCEPPDPTGKEMLVYIPFREDYDEVLCETTYSIKASDIPYGATEIRINQRR